MYNNIGHNGQQLVTHILNGNDRDQFTSMVERCNAVGVNVIADLVVNHMTGHGASGTGSGGSGFNGDSLVCMRTRGSVARVPYIGSLYSILNFSFKFVIGDEFGRNNIFRFRRLVSG